MFGFIVGTACLIGLIKVVRGGCGHGGWGGRWGRGWGGWGGHRGGGWGQSWMLRGLFSRLDTTPGQEKVISEAVDNIRNAFAKLGDEKEKIRRDVATAFKGEQFDHGPMKDAFTRQDAAMEEIQRTILVELSKVHEALNEKQRKEVGELLEHGFGWGRHGYGFASYGGCRGRFGRYHEASNVA
jgi:hypothetical protein